MGYSNLYHFLSRERAQSEVIPTVPAWQRAYDLEQRWRTLGELEIKMEMERRVAAWLSPPRQRQV